MTGLALDGDGTPHAFLAPALVPCRRQAPPCRRERTARNANSFLGGSAPSLSAHIDPSRNDGRDVGSSHPVVKCWGAPVVATHTAPRPPSDGHPPRSTPHSWMECLRLGVMAARITKLLDLSED
ncbi:unnamed protein product [Urochloa humidicola]